MKTLWLDIIEKTTDPSTPVIAPYMGYGDNWCFSGVYAIGDYFVFFRHLCTTSAQAIRAVGGENVNLISGRTSLMGRIIAVP